MTCLTNILLSDRKGKSEKLNPNLDRILNSYSSGNYVNYENINPNYSQTPHYYAIIVLGGGPEHTEYRLKKAIELYKQGIAEYLIVTAGTDDAPIAKEIIKNTGINKYIVDDRSYDTLGNALYAKEILRNLHAPENKLIAIFTEEPHCDRAITTFNLVFRGKYGIDAICIEPLPDSYMWGKEKYLNYLRPMYSIFAKSLNYLSYLPGMNDERLDKILRFSFDAGRTIVNTTLKYINKIKEYINEIIKTYRSYVYASSSS